MFSAPGAANTMAEDSGCRQKGCGNLEKLSLCRIPRLSALMLSQVFSSPHSAVKDSRLDTHRRQTDLCVGSEPGEEGGTCQKGVRIPSEFVFRFATTQWPPGLLCKNLPEAQVTHQKRNDSENKHVLYQRCVRLCLKH